MEDVSNEGRTILFVSHNLAAVRALCRRSVLLGDGEVVAEGDTNDVLSTYLSSLVSKRGMNGEVEWDDEQEAPGCSAIKLRSIRLLNSAGNVTDKFEADKPIYVEITYRVYTPIRGIRFVLIVTTQDGVIAFASTDQAKHWNKLDPGEYQSSVAISSGLLNNNKYFIKIHAGIPRVKVLIPGEEFLSLTCIGTSQHGSYFPEDWPGVVAPKLKWFHEKIGLAKNSSNI
jgi:homopolymeric O-antigen transport system ATP-binding protein